VSGLRLVVITDDVQTAVAWAANNRAQWGSWSLVLTPGELAKAPEGTPYVVVLMGRTGPYFPVFDFAPFEPVISERGLREGTAADLRHPSFA
jgi:hypothetical protein